MLSGAFCLEELRSRLYIKTKSDKTKAISNRLHIPKLVYTYGYSHDGSLRGYTNFTLAYFNPSDFDYHYHQNNERHSGYYEVIKEHPGFCRYFDYREHPESERPYKLTDAYWHVLAARLAFVIIFQVPNLLFHLLRQSHCSFFVANKCFVLLL